MKMTENRKDSSVKDYWTFTRDLRAQMNVVKMLERQFFELDDLCEWAIKNNVTCLRDFTGERVSVVDDSLGKQQAEIYARFQKEVDCLRRLLAEGKSCFIVGGEG